MSEEIFTTVGIPYVAKLHGGPADGMTLNPIAVGETPLSPLEVTLDEVTDDIALYYFESASEADGVATFDYRFGDEVTAADA